MIEREKKLNIITGMATLIAVIALLGKDVDYVRGLFFLVAGLAGNQIGMAYHMNRERKKEKASLESRQGEPKTRILRLVASGLLILLAFYEMISESFHTNYILTLIVALQLISYLDSRQRGAKTESKTSLFNAVVVVIIIAIVQFV